MINGTTLWNRSYTADMIEKTFSGKTYLTYPNLPANLYDALSLSAARHPDKTAVVDDSGATYTYTELRDMADHFSSYLYYISDIKPGTKTGVMMFNSVEFCVTFLALTKLGAVVIPLPSKYSRNEVLSLTSKADLQYILCDEKFYDWFVPLETSGVHLMKPGRGKNGFGFSHLCASYLSLCRPLAGKRMTRSSCSPPAPPLRARESLSRITASCTPLSPTKEFSR